MALRNELANASCIAWLARTMAYRDGLLLAGMVSLCGTISVQPHWNARFGTGLDRRATGESTE